MCELQMEYSRQGKNKQERKIFMLCIDCSAVLFFIISMMIVPNILPQYGTVGNREKLWVRVNGDNLPHKITLM